MSEILRNMMVDELVDSGAITTSAVEEAFRAVPRHVFLPNVSLHEAYSNRAIMVSSYSDPYPSSSSQPGLMAQMLEELRVREGACVLEIGTGTGYNAALLSYLVGPAGTVHSIEISPQMCAAARTALAETGFSRVVVIEGDGFRDIAPAPAYGGIIVTASCYSVPPWWLARLPVGGRLVLPMWLNGSDYAFAFEKETEELAISRWTCPCSFLPLVGTSETDRWRRDVTFGNENLFVIVQEDMAAEFRTARGPQRLNDLFSDGEVEGQVRFASWSHFEGLTLYLAVADGRSARIHLGFDRAGATGEGRGILLEDGSGAAALFPRWEMDGLVAQLMSFGSSEAFRILCHHLEQWKRLDKPRIEGWVVALSPVNGAFSVPRLSWSLVRGEHALHVFPASLSPIAEHATMAREGP